MRRAGRPIRRVRPNRQLWNLGQHPKGRTHRFRWLRIFPIKVFLGILGLFLLFEIFTLPILSIINLDTDNPKKTALMQQRREEASEQGKKLTIDYQWISMKSIPKHVRKAVLIAEDARFLQRVS